MGQKVIDICNEKAKELERHYKTLQSRKAQLKQELEKIEYEEMCLRNEEVKNVCEYVRTYTSLGVLNNKDIDIYLCHCENVLNGNLDGIFLTFDKELEK